jgi:hypothetical protein
MNVLELSESNFFDDFATMRNNIVSCREVKRKLIEELFKKNGQSRSDNHSKK